MWLHCGIRGSMFWGSKQGENSDSIQGCWHEKVVLRIVEKKIIKKKWGKCTARFQLMMKS